MAIKRSTVAYSLGLDLGTNSARALIVEIKTGREIATAVANFPSGQDGVIVDRKDPNLARQNPADYETALARCVQAALRLGRKSRGFKPDQIIGIGVDTTASTPLPVDEFCTPLALKTKFRKNPNAQAWLWKDHTSFAEAWQITELAAREIPDYLARCGGAYSSEWLWSKAFHCLRVDPAVFHAAASWIELCDYIPAMLTGVNNIADAKRGICAAGHKAMFHADLGGLPPFEFWEKLDPRLAQLRGNLYKTAHTSNVCAGGLSDDWARRFGLPAGTPVAIGAIDAHAGAVGAGIQPGTLVKIIGTSTCDLMIAPHSAASALQSPSVASAAQAPLVAYAVPSPSIASSVQSAPVAPADRSSSSVERASVPVRQIPTIPGVCGIVDGSILPDHYGIEAGQPAVGDLFNWFVTHVANPPNRKSGSRTTARRSAAAATENGHSDLTAAAQKLRPGESGLLALDWNNGNRSILVDVRLTGLIVGQSLHTTAAEIYRALIEATAFGARIIIDRLEESGSKISQVVASGGIAEKNPLLMQIYADVTGRPMKLSNSTQTCALGAAVYGAVAAGPARNGPRSVADAQSAMCGLKRLVYTPQPAAHAVYDRLFQLYWRLHDAFGLADSATQRSADRHGPDAPYELALARVMKDLIEIRDRARA